MADALMAKLTGAQKGGGYNSAGEEGPDGPEYPYPSKEAAAGQPTGGRRRKGHKSNSWLAHVKATMKLHPGKSFKQILKIAKKTYKRSQSQSQSGGRKRKGSKGQSQSQKKYQNGGSGGKMAGLGESAAPYV